MATDAFMGAALDGWRKKLIDLTKSNRLISLKPARNLELAAPEPETLLAGIRSGTSYLARGTDTDPDELPAHRQTVLVHRTHAETKKALTQLRRTAAEHFLERGLSVLHLAFGQLHWTTLDGDPILSPLLLVPVSLTSSGARAPLELEMGEDEAVLNPALKLMLEERGVDVSALPDAEEASIDEIIGRFREALQATQGLGTWQITSTVYLGLFDFKKEAMYRDLLDNEERIAAHPIVRALATTDPAQQTPQFHFDPVPLDAIDDAAPPEEVPLVLSADSSQRVAIAAARAGRSFVMDGPPGTGKSQTIANMIAALMHDGKSVLFVSEKIAALDVVRNRLAQHHLDSFVLEIHSSKTGRKAVSDELARTLSNRVVPRTEIDDVSRSGLVEHRKKLNAYAAATNEVREPLHRTLHDVLGRLSLLAEVPQAPDPERGTRSLSQHDLARILEAARQLSRNWRPVSDADSFVWKGVTTTRPLDREIEECLRSLARLERATEQHRTVLEALELTSIPGIGRFLDTAAIVTEIEDRSILARWLSTEDAWELTDARARLEEELEAVRTADAAVTRIAGVAWNQFPDPATAPVPPVPMSPEQLPVATDPHTPEDLLAAARSMSEKADALELRLGGLQELVRSWDLPPLTLFSQTELVRRVVEIKDRNLRPDRRWFTPQGYQEARQATMDLERQISHVHQVAGSASRFFRPDALHAPLTELQRRFETLHTGLFRQLSSAYQADKKVVESLLQNATRVKDGIDHLGEAIAWSQALQQMEQLERARAGILGIHWRRHETDYRVLYAALDEVQELQALFQGNVPPGVVEYIVGEQSNEAARRLVGSAHVAFAQWQHDAATGGPLVGRPELASRPIPDSISWLRANARVMTAAAHRAQWVDRVTGRSGSCAEAEEIITTVSGAYTAHGELATTLEAAATTFGNYVRGIEVSEKELDAALEGASKIRDLLGGPLRAEAAELFVSGSESQELSAALDEWKRTSSTLDRHFDDERRTELDGLLGTIPSARSFLESLRSDELGMQEWMDFSKNRQILHEAGLARAFAFGTERSRSAEEFPQIIERSVLAAWVEDILENDERLSPLAAADKQRLVEEYRELDQRLVGLTASRIIKAANARRPVDNGIGEPGLIRQQGNRKRKHLAVRDLIAGARHAVLGLKPVFMMSPLSVSQYLPADITFDVVIFDEASQVTPEDAINCIYRGRSVILAGDEKQLPPTAFFARSVETNPDDDGEFADLEDFESVLELASGSGAFRNLGLNWHYRSRHESLITYSNQAFYDNRLITFPSAQAYGDGIGVRFHHVSDGVYERGGSAANPVEAEAVARRIIDHYSTAPDGTLGVVTFSVAQRDAILSAVRALLEQRPDLEHLIEGGDRLGGFFVRSLESVQGDERDIILLSVGYGPDATGKISANFGPLNRKGGERRLNVAVTRARRAVELFASMTADRIPVSQSEGVARLRQYLDFAARGYEALTLPEGPTGQDPEAPFESSVIERIRLWGYEVETQVGAAGYRIDIGLLDPSRPGRYALGIECDGFHYHSARAARDRDQLRERVLTGLGWRMHRVWGTAWYRHRASEEARLKAAIDAALSGETPSAPPVLSSPVETLSVDITPEPDQEFGMPSWAIVYREAPEVPLPRATSPGDVDSAPVIAHGLKTLVRIEGPIHMDIVRERVRGWWGLTSIGSRVARNIDDAIVLHSRIKRDGDFLFATSTKTDTVRVPSAETSRSVEQVHLDELAFAVARTVRDSGSAEWDEVIQHVRALFGWRRTGDQIARRLRDAIGHALDQGLVAKRGMRLVPGEASVDAAAGQ
ncbi:DUF4011 domain-containing protein [Brachybacterium phenoliresistens]|uniref:DUF4011 domain-containing protein n=1 Tax=Brachybacterium phenoliresistens TaxID=396014 RepID=UPI0031D06200